VSRPAKTFTAKQGQYLAFIHLYTRLHRRPPAETDMQEYFQVSPPSVHQMVLTLERGGFIRRQPRTPRSIEVLVDPKCLQSYFDPGFNLSKSLCRATGLAWRQPSPGRTRKLRMRLASLPNTGFGQAQSSIS
jgi:SOS-response transcriptional repressor LexA